MNKGLFGGFGTIEDNEKWTASTTRLSELYEKESEIRSPFARDYTRILHCTAYRRLKHKTQVFFATTNDHVCTRIEHVNHVNSISKTIANFLGLNSELTDAISIGHDLGHAPFGHKGESALKSILEAKMSNNTFWHEKNSLRFVDSIETLEGPEGRHNNLNLTYAVRDGIVCHCGEVDENSLIPRDEALDLLSIEKANSVQPFTWEGCVVKVSDKIAYLGRDIEDALTLELLEPNQLDKLDRIIRDHGISESLKVNNTFLIHHFIIDLCNNSSPQCGVALSDRSLSLMNEIKTFCYDNIYKHPKVERYKGFVDYIINELFGALMEIINSGEKISVYKKYYPSLEKDFDFYLKKYAKQFYSHNEYRDIQRIYDLNEAEDRIMACIDFISGMTDQYAIKKYKESITF